MKYLKLDFCLLIKLSFVIQYAYLVFLIILGVNVLLLKRFRFQGCFLVLLAIWGQAFADQPDTTSGGLTQIPFEQLVGMEVATASKIARQISDAPSAVSIVTAQDIKDNGYRTLAEILESMRGLFITNDRAYSFLGGRGFGRPGDFTGRIMLLIDGRKANNNVYESGNLEYAGLVDPALIERVEYVSGPGSTIYGNNAFYGIINVVTKKGHDINGLQVSGTVGSYQAREGKVTYGKRLDNGAEVLLSVSGFTSPGQDFFYPETPARTGTDGISRNLDGQHSHRIFGKLEWDNWFAEIAYSTRKKDIPTAPYGATFGMPYNYEDTYLEASLKHNRQLSDNLKMSLNGYFGRFEYKGLETFVGWGFPGTPSWNEKSVGQWSGLDAQFVSTAFTSQRILFGAEARFDTKQEITTPLSRSSTDEQTFSLYAQDEITLTSQLQANLGARYDGNSEVSDKISPRAALIYSPWDTTTFKLSWSTAFRRANPFEKYYTDTVSLMQNPDIKPEHIKATELVVEHRLDNSARILASLYHYKTEDAIRSVPLGGGTSQFSNVKGDATDGAEVEFEKHWNNNFRLRTSAAYQDAQNGDGNWPANSPRAIGKLNLSSPLPWEGWRAALEMQAYSGRMTEHATRTGGYSLTNLTISSDRLLPNLDVALGIRNLFDRDYVNVAPPGNLWQDTLRQDGRNFWLRMTYDFK